MAMKKCVSRNKRKQDQEKTAELILQVVSGECCAPQNRLENFLYICPLRRAFPGENGSAQHSPDTTHLSARALINYGRSSWFASQLGYERQSVAGYVVPARSPGGWRGTAVGRRPRGHRSSSGGGGPSLAQQEFP